MPAPVPRSRSPYVHHPCCRRRTTGRSDPGTPTIAWPTAVQRRPPPFFVLRAGRPVSPTDDGYITLIRFVSLLLVFVKFYEVWRGSLAHGRVPYGSPGQSSELPRGGGSRERELAAGIELIGDAGGIDRDLAAPSQERAVGSLDDADNAARETGVEPHPLAPAN